MATLTKAESSPDVAGWSCQWRISKYLGDVAPENLYAEDTIDGNMVTIVGVQVILERISQSSSASLYSNINASIIVGNNSTNTPEKFNVVAMQGATTTGKGMDATYPLYTLDANSLVSQITFQSTFGTSVGNHDWYEIGVSNNPTPGSGNLLNRKVGYLGTKVSGTSWVVQVIFTLSSPVAGSTVSISDYVSMWQLGNTADSAGSNTLSIGGGGTPTYTSSNGKGGGQYATINADCDFRTASLPSSRVLDFTVTGWFYATAWNGSVHSFGYDGASTHGYNLRVESSGTLLKLYAYGATTSVSISTTVALNTWYFVAYYRKGGNLFLSVNGVVVASTSLASVGGMTASGTYAIGSRVSTDRFTGRLSAWTHHARALTSAGINKLYNAGLGLAYTARSVEYPCFADPLSGGSGTYLNTYTPTSGGVWGGTDPDKFIFTTRGGLRLYGSTVANTHYKATTTNPVVSNGYQTNGDWWVQADLTVHTAQNSIGSAFASSQPLYCAFVGIACRISLTSGDNAHCVFGYRGSTQSWHFMVNGTFQNSVASSIFDTLTLIGSDYQQCRNIRLECDREYLRGYVDGSLVLSQSVYSNIGTVGYVGVYAYTENSTLYQPTDAECLEITNLVTGSLY